MNYKNYLHKYTLIFILAIICFVILYKFYTNKNDTFLLPQITTPSMPANFERTQLYGTLFLDGLNKVITNMTDPPITYDTQRIELIKYSDILL